MFETINNVFLKMTWLSDAISWSLASLGLDLTTRLGGSIQFFLYDIVKIAILLVVVIFIISYIQSYFPPERTRRILGKLNGIWANIAGALMGTITPFCACSSIPLFIGFTRAGLPIGVTFSFLISSHDGRSRLTHSTCECFQLENRFDVHDNRTLLGDYRRNVDGQDEARRGRSHRLCTTAR